MRLILTTVAAATLLAGTAGAALAHGGAYRGPGGEVPPDSREPSDPPPPPEGGGGGTPPGEGGGGPTTGGGGGGGGNTGGGGGGDTSGGGGGGGPPPGGGGGGPTTGGAKPKGGSKGPGYEDWTFWWNYNKDSLLNLKKMIKERQKTAGTGTGTHVLGSKGGGAVLTATDAAIQSEIVPKLKQILEMNPKDIHSDIQSAAELALAKIGQMDVVDRLQEMALNEKKIYDQIIQESGALAFGLLQKDTPEIRAFLLEILNNKEIGGRFTRSFAALSLGLIGAKNDKDHAVANGLLAIVSGKETGQDVKPTALLALGLLGDDTVVETLVTMLKTSKDPKSSQDLGDNELAYIVQSLGRLGRTGLDKAGQETAVLDAVTAVLAEKSDAAPNVRRSAAIALGQFGARADAKTAAKLVDILKSVIIDAKDAQERHFALISVGRIGSADGMDAKVRDACVGVLNHHLDKGKQLTPTFAAMGIGLIGQKLKAEGTATLDDEKFGKPLRDKFADTKEPRSRGAFAVASGMIRDSKAVEGLREVLKEKGDAKLRGYCALALGMMGAQEARNDIRTVLTGDGDKDLRIQAAVGAALMADSAVIDDLVKILQDPQQSQYVLGSVALSLGQLGDEKAIKPLVTIMMSDKDYPDLTRALATVALGQIGDRKDIPVLSRLTTDINYRVGVASIIEVVTIL